MSLIRRARLLAAIEGIDGVLLAKGDRVGLAGNLPQLAANRGADLGLKVIRDPASC